MLGLLIRLDDLTAGVRGARSIAFSSRLKEIPKFSWDQQFPGLPAGYGVAAKQSSVSFRYQP